MTGTSLLYPTFTTFVSSCYWNHAPAITLLFQQTVDSSITLFDTSVVLGLLFLGLKDLSQVRGEENTGDLPVRRSLITECHRPIIKFTESSLGFLPKRMTLSIV